jgi:hypothetical protein
MLFLVFFMMLLSPFRLVFANASPEELFPIDAVTVDLEPLDQMLTNMRAFVDAAKDVYTEYFVKNHFNTLDMHDPWTSEIYTVHDYLNIIRFETDADLSSCAFSNSGIDLCDHSESDLASIRAILYSEIVRTRTCAATISKLRQQAAGLSETFRVALQHLQLMENLFYVQFSLPEPEADAIGLPPPDILAQYLQLRTRVLALGHEFQLLLLSSMAYLPNNYNVTDFQYLKDLQTTLLEAGRNAETTSNLGCWVLFSGRHEPAMKSYRKALCLRARGQIPANDASTASVRAAAFRKVKWW